MHENSGNSVIFYAHYTEGGVNKTGLTVTIDVYEVIRDGTATLVVDDGACTEIGAGLYRYLLAAATVDAAAEYVGVFHTATDTVDAQDIPAIWVINRANTQDIDAILADTGTDGVVVASLKNDTITAASLKADAVDEILDEIVVGTYTMRQLLKLFAAKMHGKATGGGTTSIKYTGLDGTADVIIETVDTSGNRSNVALTV